MFKITHFVFYFFALLFCSNSAVFAQCKDCTPIKEKMGECFTHAGFSGYCAYFKQGSSYFYFQNAKKKTSKLALAGHEEVGYFVRLVENNKLKPKDLLFVQEALKFWDNKQPQTEEFRVQDSGLAWKISQEGKGEIPQAGEKLKLRYRLLSKEKMLIDQQIDTPFEVVLEQTTLIKGIVEALTLARKGSTLWLKIPSHLAFGEKTYGNIPANSTLFCELEILE